VEEAALQRSGTGSRIEAGASLPRDIRQIAMRDGAAAALVKQRGITTLQELVRFRFLRTSSLRRRALLERLELATDTECHSIEPLVTHVNVSAK
jgi:hypothetical protein